MIDVESLVRRAMVEHTEGLELRVDMAARALAAGRRRRRQRRLGLAVAVGAVFVLAAAGIATATGVIGPPWWTPHVAENATQFGAVPDPANVPGGKALFRWPGPESSTFEVATYPLSGGSDGVGCTGFAVRDADGGWQRLPTGCGPGGVLTPTAAMSDWHAPSGAVYAVVTGPRPTATAVTAALEESNGVTSVIEPIGGGYYLVYVPAEGLSATGTLVFADEAGHVVEKIALNLAPLRPCNMAAPVVPCG